MGRFYSGSIIGANDFSNFFIGGNLTNAFVLGSMGASDDFFLVGTPATRPDEYPILTGNFLDSEGNHLCRLVKNVLTVNPRNCSKILGNHIGYEIFDGEGRRVLKVESQYDNPHHLVTSIEGEFFDKNKKVVASTDENGFHVPSDTKHAMGFGGGRFTMGSGLSYEEIIAAGACMETGGAVHQIVSGRITGQDIEMDGKIFMTAIIENCRLHVERGDFSLYTGRFSNNAYVFHGGAINISDIVERTLSQDNMRKSGAKCILSGKYISRGCPHSTERMFAEGDEIPVCPQCGQRVFWCLQEA